MERAYVIGVLVTAGVGALAWAALLTHGLYLFGRAFVLDRRFDAPAWLPKSLNCDLADIACFFFVLALWVLAAAIFWPLLIVGAGYVALIFALRKINRTRSF